jgi:SWI/SNF-related matrix-associated actin-dependent regulator 1 of chromatin subfamily A
MNSIRLTSAEGKANKVLFFLGAEGRVPVDPASAGFIAVEHRPAAGEPAPDLPLHWRWWTTSSKYGAALFAEFADEKTRSLLADVCSMVELSRARDSLDDYPCPSTESYLPFQRAGIQYALAVKRAIIADEMGLGKTVQALGVANTIKAKKILVICPASIRLQWLTQCRRWLIDGKERFIYPIFNSKNGVPKNADIVIISYDLSTSPSIWESIASRSWDLLILDEAHYLKNYNAARTRTILGSEVVKSTEFVVALTGTPLPNRPHELHTIVKALNWSAIDRMSFKKFTAIYNPEIRKNNIIVARSTRFLLELQTRLRANLMIRRTKSEVANELPAKTYEIIEVEQTGGIKKALAAESLLTLDISKIGRLTIEERSAIATVRRQMGIAKAPLVVDYIDTLLSGGLQKLVVFAWHHDVIDLISDGLKKLKHDHVVLTGKTPATSRANLIDSFCNNESVRVFLAQLQAGGTGIDGLQKAANFCVFAECSWTFGDNEQAADRLHRSGQDLPVTVQFLVAPGSIDKRVLTAALEKCRIANEALDKEVK